MKNIFISIEGVDGTGKTTTAELVAREGSFQYYKSPNGIFSQLRKEVDIHASPIERYCFYCLSNNFDSANISKMLENGSVVCDRYVSSTLAYHLAMDPRIKDIHNDENLIKPDFAFLLGTRSEVRDKRIFDRGNKTSDIALEQNSLFLDHVAAIFRSLGLIYIDTSDIPAEEVVKKIKNILKRGGLP